MGSPALCSCLSLLLLVLFCVLGRVLHCVRFLVLHCVVGLVRDPAVYPRLSPSWFSLAPRAWLHCCAVFGRK
jgi:hypothetical protein